MLGRHSYLAGEVDLNGLNANVLRAGGHDCTDIFFLVWRRGFRGVVVCRWECKANTDLGYGVYEGLGASEVRGLNSECASPRSFVSPTRED